MTHVELDETKPVLFDSKTGEAIRNATYEERINSEQSDREGGNGWFTANVYGIEMPCFVADFDQVK